MASIEILLGRQVLDMAYFRHNHHYGHLLYIIKQNIQSGRKPLLCTTSGWNYIEQHWIEMLAFRGPTPSDRHHAFFNEHADTTTLYLNIWCFLIENVL